MIKHNVAQGSTDWFLLRAAKPTASEFDNLISPVKWKARDGEKPSSYLAAKVAEYWQGGPLAQFTGWDMDQGQLLEREGFGWMECELGKKIERVGFITDDAGLIGCSPDGMLEDCGIEFKCLQPTHHVACLLKGGLPTEFAAQVHGGMYVTGLKKWLLVLYRRKFPNLIVTVERDDEIQEAIDDALSAFLARFAAAKAYLIDLNGGPPKRSAIPQQQPKIEDPAWVEDIMP